MSRSKSKNNTKIDINFIPLSEASKISGYTPEYLNSLSRKGILHAQKIGRNWYTTEEWLAEFLNSNSVGKEKEIKKQISHVEYQIKSSPKEDLEEKYNQPVGPAEEDTHKTLDQAKSISPKSSFFRILAGLSSVVIIIPLIFIFVYFTKIYSTQKNWEAAKIAIVKKIPTQVILNENDSGAIGNVSQEVVSGIVQGEATSSVDEAIKKAGIILSSENYKASSVSLGGEIILTSSTENLPPEITDVKSESFIVTDNNSTQNNSSEEVELVISWKTNKLAKSEIQYSKNNGQDPRSIEEQSYGFDHSVVLTGMDPQTSYVYQIKCKDHWGTEVDSDFYGLFTSSRPVSVFDLIAKQISEIFGWAIKK